MRRLLFVLTVLCIMVPTITACENDRVVAGYSWTFHRMSDGNAYHECRLNSSFEEGSSLVMVNPCNMRYIDSVQVDWSDKRGKMRCTLITTPGRKRISTIDVSSKHRGSWAVNHKVQEFEFAFSGPRDQSVHINFIRVFYGKNASHNTNSDADISNISGAPDRIKFIKGPKERPCRLIRWNGSQLVVKIKRRRAGLIKRKLDVATIRYIHLKPRWVRGILINGEHVKIRISRIEGNRMWFEKDINGSIIKKKNYPIEKFKVIEF